MGAAARRAASWEYVAICLIGRAAAPISILWVCLRWLVCVKNTRSTFGRATRPRFSIYPLCAFFCFLSFFLSSRSFFHSLLLCVFLFPLLFPFLLDLLPSLFLFFVFVLFLLLVFPLSCPVFLCFSLISIIYNNIIIKTFISLVCAYVHTRAHAYTHARGREQNKARKKEGDQNSRPRLLPCQILRSNVKAISILFPNISLSR